MFLVPWNKPKPFWLSCTQTGLKRALSNQNHQVFSSLSGTCSGNNPLTHESSWLEAASKLTHLSGKTVVSDQRIA